MVTCWSVRESLGEETGGPPPLDLGELLRRGSSDAPEAGDGRSGEGDRRIDVVIWAGSSAETGG